MRSRNALEMLVLAAVWGGSFLFVRIAAPELGPVALIWLRVGIGALCLVPVAALGRRSCVILAGTALATGLLRLPAPAAARPAGAGELGGSAR